MKVWKKCEVLFLTVLLCITMMAVPVLAASDSQDGLEVTLTTDKEKYSKGEEIVATLTVTNTNDTAVSNVSLENLIPEGYKLADGSEGAKQVESLGAGETVSMTVTYVAEESDAGEDKPNTGDDNKGIQKNQIQETIRVTLEISERIRVIPRQVAAPIRRKNPM